VQRPVREPLSEGSTLHNGVYTIGHVVGVGGFSLTYLGFQGPLRLPVAIKEFFPNGCVRHPDGIYPSHPWNMDSFASALDTFQREGSILERFHHPSIVRVHSQFQENRSAYLVEELLEGETLGEGLTRAGAMALPQAIAVAEQVGQALSLVHAGGLVHSDLKPDNLFWTQEGRYVILDFGVSRGYLSDKAAKEGMAAVSPGYSPPEQYDRQAKLTPAADVYALAATLYHLLVGYPPLDARKRLKGEKLTAIRSINPTCTAEVEQALFAGLQLDLKKRTATMRQFLEDLGVEISNRVHQGATQEFTLLGDALAHTGGTHAIALHSPSRRLFSGGKDGRICLWTWPDLQLLGGLAAHQGPINALAVSPDGGYLVSGSQAGEIKMWDAAAGVEIQTLVAGGSAVMRLSFHPEGGMLAVAFTDGRCALMGPSLPKPISWQAHKGSVNAVDISPDGLVLATGADDKSIHLWRMPDGRFLRSILGHDKLLQSVRFSPDGRLLISGSNDMSVRLWDLAAQMEMRNLKGHKGMVWDAQFTVSPEIVISISADRCLRAIRVDNGRTVVCSEAHEGWARALAVDPHQPLVVTGGADGHVRLWEIPRVL
jgi:WD40 repeat protein